MFKQTDKTPQAVNLSDREILIPAETFVFVKLPAIHSKPEYWGEDSLQWRPNRWITTNSVGEETFVEPKKGTFIGWASGPRVCPGKKFAQVEFVAIFATLFRKHTVKPVLKYGETAEEARVRLFTKVQDVDLYASFRVHNPEALPLLWEERA